MQARVRSAMLSVNRVGVWADAARAVRANMPTHVVAARRAKDCVHEKNSFLP